ncbi:TPA: hypothetical protein ACOQ39_006093 [Bacillus cereus]|uniref:hypothetical protein n=1 Tax=Bacteria TaxID=2 RepID=UPI0008FDB450|nr:MULTISPECIES: hypothetical protein [Bacillus cereus group]HDR7946175.1 hypothetical protein [Bacillus wiedmannii]HDR8294863.1 hypothetical protein [Bacillus cereus]MCC2375834.1 hypothetical protein [Bacillus paranthracis]OJE39115.1 hypothetical protein BAQ44_11980 [Bacillus mobilis]HDR7244837.1 hypothetical protein [Bacillus mobilis]
MGIGQMIMRSEKLIGVLKEKAYLSLSDEERAEIKELHKFMKTQVTEFLAVDEELKQNYQELDSILGSQEGFYWMYVTE